jgi:hypothetical protein
VTDSDILDSDHLSIVFHTLEHVTTKKLSEPFEKVTDWERFQNLASNLISPRIEINSGVEAVKSCTGIYGLHCFGVQAVAGLHKLLKHKKRLRKYGKKPGTQCVRRNLIGSRK